MFTMFPFASCYFEMAKTLLQHRFLFLSSCYFGMVEICCFECLQCFPFASCYFEMAETLLQHRFLFNTECPANIRNLNRTRQSNGLPSVLSDPGPKTVNIPTYGVHCEIPLCGQPVWAAGLSSHLFRQGYGATCNSGQGGLKQNGRYL